MSLVNCTQLAVEFGVTKGAVSQWARQGKLDGCFEGDGRGRRYDLNKCAEALGKNLDAGQRLGNGAKTNIAAKRISSAELKPKLTESGELPPEDLSRYEMARTLKAEEEGRTLRRRNAEAEGIYVLTSEVSRQVVKQIGQEVAEFETVLKDGARKVADLHGIDFKKVRQILIEQWRCHRAVRAKQIASGIASLELTDAEKDEDI